MWDWRTKNAREVTERFIEWKDKGKYEILYPVSIMIDLNNGFMVVEADDMAELQKDTAPWTDICNFEFIPIMDSLDGITAYRE